MKKQLFYLLLAAGVLSACGPAAPQLGKDSVEDVIGAMTLEEKAHLVIGTGMVGTSGDSTVIGTTKKLVPGAAGTTYPIPRLGIPAIVLADGPAYRSYPRRGFCYLLLYTFSYRYVTCFYLESGFGRGSWKINW